MASLKRRIYALPLMAPYRRHRARALSRPVEFAEGFTLRCLDEGFAEFEAVERKVMADLMRRSDAFVDVGAHHGFYSALAVHLGIPAIAVEPDEANLAILSMNAKGRSIEICPKAMSDQPGRMAFFGDGEVGSLNSDWEGSAAFFRRMVDVTTLDHFLAGRFIGERLLIKVDVEGNEDKVLDGARAVLERPGVHWMIETQAVSPSGKPCAAFIRLFDIMEGAGYLGRYAVTGEAATREQVGVAADAALRNIVFQR